MYVPCMVNCCSLVGYLSLEALTTHLKVRTACVFFDNGFATVKRVDGEVALDSQVYRTLGSSIWDA